MSLSLPKKSTIENHVEITPPPPPPPVPLKNHEEKLTETLIKTKTNNPKKTECLFINNNYSTIGNNDSFDDPIYDDVIYNNNSIKIESCVNSIYADGSFISELNSIYARDSDWEDIDDIDLSKKSSSVV